jgi:hypothetical protein
MRVRRLPEISSCRRILQIAREAVSAAGMLQASSSPVDTLPSAVHPNTAAVNMCMPVVTSTLHSMQPVWRSPMQSP